MFALPPIGYLSAGFAVQKCDKQRFAFLAKVGSSFNVLSPSGYLRTLYLSYRFAA